MDTAEFGLNILAGVAANVLSSLLMQLRVSKANDVDRPLQHVESFENAFSKAAAATAKTLGVQTPRTQKLKSYLSSPEVEAILRQLFAQHLAGKGDDMSLARLEFSSSMKAYVGLTESEDKELAGPLFDSLVKACLVSLDRAIGSNSLSAHEAKSAYRNRLLEDELRSINRNLEFLRNEQDLRVDEIIKYETKLRARVQYEFRSIVPPDVEASVEVPIEKIYVAPSLSTIPKAKDENALQISVLHFAHVAYRAVILGNPGGGKSTLARKLCYDLTARHEDRLFGGRKLTPLMVTLRDYGSERRKQGCSIVEFIESVSKNDYQQPAPKGAIEYLLLSGRAIVIFDGLDELLDTTDRIAIKKAVEHFVCVYPSVPVLVTSREVGYEQAPLDPQLFEVFKLSPFDQEQVSEYVFKWFSLNMMYSPQEQQKRADSFLRESAIVPDLRSNPLMLALMCTIYKQEGYIPANRPDVYGKCAELLFVKWDKKRGIHYALPFEHHVRPAINHVAFWIYSNADLQKGVAECLLIEETSNYLRRWCFDDEHEARSAAQDFIEFCRGRAWVLSEMGTGETGEGLYQFTHRTFLEYFAAEQLVQVHRSTQDLLDELAPRIERREWDVVAQLAFQLKSKSFQGAADDLLLAIINTDPANLLKLSNNLSFAARCLEFMVPTPHTRKEITRKCLKLLTAPEFFKTRRENDREATPLDILGALANVSSDNLAAVATAAREVITEALQKENYEAQSVAVEILFHLTRMVGREFERRKEVWKRLADEIFVERKELLLAVASRNLGCAVDLFWNNLITVEQVAEWHGVRALYDNSQIALFIGNRVPIVSSLLLGVSQGEPDFESLVSLGQLVLKAPKPVCGGHFIERHYAFDYEQSKQLVVTDPKVVFGIFTGIAPLYEPQDGASIQRRRPNILDLEKIGLPELAKVVTSRANGTPIGEQALSDLQFGPEETQLVRAWISKVVNLVEP